MKSQKLFALVSAAALLTSCNQKPESSILQPTEQTTTVTVSATTPTVTTTTTVPTQTSHTVGYSYNTYQAVGCGGKKPEKPSENLNSSSVYFPPEEDGFPILTEENISDAEVLKMVQDWMQSAKAELAEQQKALHTLAEKNPSVHDTTEYTSPTYCTISYFNGYILLYASLNYEMDLKLISQGSSDKEDSNIFARVPRSFYSCSAFLDCETKQYLTLPELFYDGTDFMKILNDEVAIEIQQPESQGETGFTYVEQKRPFAGLTEGDFSFNVYSPDSISLDVFASNPYFPYGITVRMESSTIRKFMLENCVLFRYRELPIDSCFETITDNCNERLGIDPNFEYYNAGNENLIVFERMLKSSSLWSQEKVDQANAVAMEMAHSKETADLAKQYWNYNVSDAPTASGYMDSKALFLDMNIALEQKMLFVSIAPYHMDCYSGAITNAYDTDTFRRLSNSEVIERFFGTNPADRLQINAHGIDVEKTNAEILATVDDMHLMSVYMYSTPALSLYPGGEFVYDEPPYYDISLPQTDFT